MDPIFILRELVKTKFNTHQLQGYLFKFSWNKGVVATSHFFWPSKHANFLENLELLDCLIKKKSAVVQRDKTITTLLLSKTWWTLI